MIMTHGKSVVVPVDLAETPAIRNALGLYRSAILCGEQWSDTCRAAYLAALKELDQLAMLAAAPAPSSLAGGEAESRALDWMEWVAQGALDTDDVQLSGVEIIQHAEIELASIRKQAALSPEAPAEGAGEREEIARIMDQKGWETRDRQYEAIKRSTMHDKDRPLAFANADYYTRDSLTKADAILALRARSSAPEAREVKP